MGSLKELKKYSSTIAGVIYVAYSVFLLAAAELGSGTVTTLALLGAGVCCFIPKSQSVKGGFLVLVAVLMISSTLGAIFEYIKMPFRGLLDVLYVVIFLASLVTAFIRILAAFLLAAFVFPGWKKSANLVEKCWSVPAVLTFVAMLIDTVLSYLNLLVYGEYYGQASSLLSSVILSFAFVIGQAAMGLSAVDEELDNTN